MKKFIDYFINDKLKADAELYRKGRFTVALMFIVVGIVLLFMVYTLIAFPGQIIGYIAGTSCLSIVAICLYVLKKRGSFTLVATLICAITFLAVSSAPYTTGGIYSPDIYTLILIPVIALFVGTMRLGVVFLIICFIGIMSFYLFELLHLSDYRAMTDTLKSEYYMFNVVTVYIALGFLVFRNEKLRLTLVKEIRAALQTIAQKNEEITDSINYAQRIQSAQLPELKDIYSAFEQSFVIYIPKAIVSGDFYFFRVLDEKVLIAAADCTGHGVPGALMSMVAYQRLTDVTAGKTNVSEMLSSVNKSIKTSLRQSDNELSTRDGMDIALCAVDIKKRHIEYSGANRPLWLFRKGQKEVEEIKATKVPIGGLTKNEQIFEKHELALQHGDTFYICTDGFADQFSQGGKKLTTKKFKKILADIQDKSMKEQQKYLSEFIETWKGNSEQLDDILVIGVRLS